MPENCPHLLRGLYLGLHRRVRQFGTDKLNPDKNDERCCRERHEQRKVTSLLHRMLSQRKPVAKLFHQPIAGHSSLLSYWANTSSVAATSFKESLRLPHDANVEAVVDKDVVNILPAGSVCPASVYQ